MRAAASQAYSRIQAAIAGPSRARVPVPGRGETGVNDALKGTETSDWARDQVLLRVRSTCSTSAATMGRSNRPPGKTPVS